MQPDIAVGAAPLNRNVKAILYNRILVFLGFLGIFIAGAISLAKVMGVVLPCGTGGTCETVLNDPSSVFLGIPVAYIGLGAYILLTAMAIIRSMPNSKNFMRLTLIGYLFAAGGMLISIGLQAYSIFVIQALCKWCLSSAATMTATLIVYALLYQDASELSEEELQGLRTASAKPDFMVNTGFAGVTAIALVGQGFFLHNADHTKGRVLTNLPKNYPLIPAKPKVFGDINAPIKVIEFADLNCPSCQIQSPRIKEFARQHPGKICIVFRNFPLPSHETSQLAAAIDTYAAEKGKFWDYTMAVMETRKEVKDPAELFSIATSVGLDANDIKKRLANTGTDPIYADLTADENAGNVVGISMTPTFILEIPGQLPKAFTGSGMYDALSQAPYAALLK